GATVTADGTSVEVEAGTFTTVPLDEDLNAAGEPADPEPYEAGDFEFLPTTLLEEDIEIAGMEGGEQAGASGSLNITTGTWVFNYTEFSGCGMPEGMVNQLTGITVDIDSTEMEDFFS